MKVRFLILFVLVFFSYETQAQQISASFSSEVETFIATSFYKKQGKNLGMEKGTRFEKNESSIKIKDFKTILYSNFPTYYAVSEYQKKGSEELMDQMNTAFMSSKLIKYRVDSKNSPEVLSSEEKNSGISRKIILKNSIQKVLAYILLDKNNKLIIQFAEENI